ncbi:Trans-acting T-cell-specific transcription factor GATA-3, variant 2 [Balamuthia mandrillaris]
MGADAKPPVHSSRNTVYRHPQPHVLPHPFRPSYPQQPRVYTSGNQTTSIPVSSSQYHHYRYTYPRHHLQHEPDACYSGQQDIPPSGYVPMLINEDKPLLHPPLPFGEGGGAGGRTPKFPAEQLQPQHYQHQHSGNDDQNQPPQQTVRVLEAGEETETKASEVEWQDWDDTHPLEMLMLNEPATASASSSISFNSTYSFQTLASLGLSHLSTDATQDDEDGRVNRFNWGWSAIEPVIEERMEQKRKRVVEKQRIFFRPDVPVSNSFCDEHPQDNDDRKEDSEDRKSKRRERRSIGIWNDDAHLHLFNGVLRYLDMYREHMWAVHPLHPAAMDEINVRYIFSTTEGAEDTSALALCVNLVIAIGAALQGDLPNMTQFYRRARALLEYTFDLTDYNVALALSCMSHHTLFWEMDPVRSSYYNTLAMNICRRLKAFHSDAYQRCLCVNGLSSYTSEAEPEIAQKLVELKDEIERTKRYPYYQDNLLCSDMDLISFASLTTTSSSSSSSSSTSCSASQRETHSLQKRYKNQPRLFRHMRLMTSATGVMTSVVFGISLHRAHKKTLKKNRLQQCHQHAYKHDNEHKTAVDFVFLIHALDTLERELRSLRDSNELPPTAFVNMITFICALRARCYWCMGQRTTALAWAERYLAEATNDPYFGFILAGIMLMLDLIFTIFLKSGRLDLLESLLRVTEKNARVCPAVGGLREQYRQLAAAKQNEKKKEEEDEEEGDDFVEAFLVGNSPDSGGEFHHGSFSQMLDNMLSSTQLGLPSPH